MEPEEYFPKGLALGKAFCNRQAERQRLTQNLQTHQHTLVISPRRYGKTSLVKQVFLEKKILYGEADLFVAVDASQIAGQIIAAVKRLIAQCCSTLEQTIRLLSEAFKPMGAKWLIGTQGINLELIPQNLTPAAAILQAVQAVENILKKKNKTAVLFIDEIQEIGEVADGRGIEGAIRHIAQQTHYLSLVFSGSKRHLLSTMFYDKSRPLYKLCDKISLHRIAEADYCSHLEAYAKAYWKTALKKETLTAIFQHTERHPYYVNTLCLKLWQHSQGITPSVKDVSKAWISLLEEEKHEVMRELSVLSHTQRKLLIAIANNYTNKLTGKIFLQKIGLSGSAVTESLRLLEQKDYLEKVDPKGNYQILDPAIKSILVHHYEF